VECDTVLSCHRLLHNVTAGSSEGTETSIVLPGRTADHMVGDKSIFECDSLLKMTSNGALKGSEGSSR
jgi:hypothetical protein